MTSTILKNLGHAVLIGVLVAAATALLTFDANLITDWRNFAAGFGSRLVVGAASAVLAVLKDG